MALRSKDRWILAGVAALVAGLVVLIGATIDAGREGIPRSDDWTETARELSRALRSDDPPQVVDARSAASFAGGHIPGSFSLPAEELIDPSVGATLPWPQVAQRVRATGLDPGRKAVVYAAEPADAAYIVWVLRAIGLQEVRLLAGGINAWLEAGEKLVPGDPAQGGPIDPEKAQGGTGAAAGRSSEWPADRIQTPDPEYAIDLGALSGSGGSNMQLVDVRRAPASQVAIPGAVTYRVPVDALVDGQGIKRSRIALRKALASLRAEEVIVYGDEIREAALGWWAVVGQGYRARLFYDGYILWEASGLPTEPVTATGEASTVQPGRRQGAGCG